MIILFVFFILWGIRKCNIRILDENIMWSKAQNKYFHIVTFLSQKRVKEIFSCCWRRQEILKCCLNRLCRVRILGLNTVLKKSRSRKYSESEKGILRMKSKNTSGFKRCWLSIYESYFLKENLVEQILGCQRENRCEGIVCMSFLDCFTVFQLKTGSW